MIDQLTIIIPVFNEQRTIYQLLEKIADLQLINNLNKEIVVVNDASTDASKEMKKKGKAAGIKTWILKPIKKETFLGTVNLLVEKFSSN